MARIFVDGFEGGGTDLWSSSSNVTITASPPAGFSGAYYAVPTASGVLKKSLSTSYSEIYIAFKMRYSGAQPEILTLYDSAGTLIFALGRTAAAKLQCYRSAAGGTAIGSLSTVVLTTNQVYLVEVYYKPLNSNGLVTVKVDGTTEITIAALDALDTTAGLENVQTFWIGAQAGYTCINALDDVVVDTASWIGNTKITALAPTGAGATTGWTPSAGNNYACVDEVPASDIDYVKINTENAIDTYAMGDLPADAGIIKAVAVQSRNWRVGNGTVNKIQHVLRPASTDRVGVSSGMIPITAVSIQTIWELNPEDSAAWEAADVNGMEIGVKAVAS